MKKNLLLSSVFACLCLSAFGTQANDKVESTYNAQKYQQVCKGKSEGAAVSFAAHGIIWNGNCKTQFFPTGKNANKIAPANLAELSSICSSNPNQTSIDIEGKQYNGKCALGFAAPAPASNS